MWGSFYPESASDTKDGSRGGNHRLAKIISPQLHEVSLGTLSVPALVSVLRVLSDGRASAPWPPTVRAVVEPTGLRLVWKMVVVTY